MERLKELFYNAGAVVYFLFTFQYGEIKSRDKLRCTAPMVGFTFQYGEIKSWRHWQLQIGVLWFTFQYGEIKSCI